MACCWHGTYLPASGAGWARADASGVLGQARPLPNRLGQLDQGGGRCGRGVPAAVLRTLGDAPLAGSPGCSRPAGPARGAAGVGPAALARVQEVGPAAPAAPQTPFPVVPALGVLASPLTTAAAQRNSFDAHATVPRRRPRPGWGTPTSRPARPRALPEHAGVKGVCCERVGLGDAACGARRCDRPVSGSCQGGIPGGAGGLWARSWVEWRPLPARTRGRCNPGLITARATPGPALHFITRLRSGPLLPPVRLRLDN